jgi:hypothetical protein
MGGEPTRRNVMLKVSTPGQRPHKVWTVVLASLGVFMTALDTLVVTTSLPCCG